MIDCREAVRRMWTYLDRSLGAEPLAALQQHLDTCVQCCGELEFSRQLRGMVAASERPPTVPTEVQKRIDRILMLEPEDGRRGSA